MAWPQAIYKRGERYPCWTALNPHHVLQERMI